MAGDFEALVRDVADNDLFDTAGFGSGDTAQPDGPSAKDQHGVTGLGMGELDGMHGTGQRLAECAGHKRNIGG
jgi:hypothetical protein